MCSSGVPDGLAAISREALGAGFTIESMFPNETVTRWVEMGGYPIARDHGSTAAEYGFLRETVAVLDLSHRGRLCVTGADRARFLHGQVTNAVKDLKPGEGCYAALVTAKGRLVSDLHIHCLRDELLLDLEPGCAERVRARLEEFVIADDVQVVDIAPHYAHFSVLGPAAPALMGRLSLALDGLPGPGQLRQVNDPAWGEVVCAHQPRGAETGFDLFVPTGVGVEVAGRLLKEARTAGGGPVGWDALELVRVEAGIPRFGADMDETNLAPEAGIESRAISYQKGCYIGQEVIARIRTYGQVTRALRGLTLPVELPALPPKGAVLRHAGREVGQITSAVQSLRLKRPIALGYVRKECNAVGTELECVVDGVGWPAVIVPVPFQ